MSQSAPFRRHLCLLDVGHGNCAVVIAGESDVVVIDVGRQSTLSEFLSKQGITHLRSIYLSHADADHIGGLVGILATNEVTIDRVFVNSDSSKGSAIWDDLLYELESAHFAGKLEFKIELVAGHSENLGGGVEVDVLGPGQYLAGKGPGSRLRSGEKVSSNSLSATIAISVHSCRIALLPGDIDWVGLKYLLRDSQNISAPILVYPHHGGQPKAGTKAREFSGTLLAKVNPDLVVFSIGRDAYSNPNPETVHAIRQELPRARIVCTQLSRHCATELGAMHDDHLSSAFARGRERGLCCGGTIVVPLDDCSAVQPGQDSHIEFIRHNAPTALCKYQPRE